MFINTNTIINLLIVMNINYKWIIIKLILRNYSIII